LGAATTASARSPAFLPARPRSRHRARAGFPCCTLGVCLPLYSCLCCTCERKDNAWITRDKHGKMTGAIMLLDHERGTIAMYGVKCCTQTLDDHPQCYCTKYPGAPG